MKKRWIFFIVAATALLFVAGVWLGTNIDLKELTSKNTIKKDINTKIAVVNYPDEEEFIEDVHFSDAFISSLHDEYKIVNYEEAKRGMENGLYAAMVEFPPNLTTKVNSMNSSSPEKAKITFKINPSLSESAYLSTYLKVMDLQNDLEEAISYVCTKALYDEFYDAQNKTKQIFTNNNKDMDALNDVELHDFRLKVNWSDIPQVEFNPTEINFNEFVATVQGYADTMSKAYTDSYDVAKADYEVFQAQFSDSADKISIEGQSWYDQVKQREEKVSEHVSALATYRTDLSEWSGRAKLWNGANSVWHNNLSGYRDNVFDWKNRVSDWKNKTMDWGSAFQADMLNYQSSIDTYKNKVDEYLGNINNHYKNTDSWAKNYTDYAASAETFFTNIKELVTDYNEFAINYNTQKGEFLKYIESAENDSKNLSNCKSNLETAIDYFNQLKTFYLGNDQTNGLVQNNSELYDTLLLYNQSLAQYKTKLETYVGHKIDQDIHYDSFRLDELVSKIKDQKNQIDTFIANNQLKFDNANTKIEEINHIELPTLSDYSSLASEEELTTIDNNKLQSFISQDKLTEWRGTYNGNAPDAQTIVTSEENLTNLSKEKEVQDVEDFDKDLPQFEGGDFEELNITEPGELNDQPPEVPQILLDNCNSIISESKKYIPTNYLNDETKSKVNEVVGRYADNLTVVDSRLTANMVSNNNLLTQSYNGYNRYVYTLRSDADKAYNAEVDDLNKTVDSFSSVKIGTSENNKKLLNSFSEKLPYSKNNTIEYAKWTASPLIFAHGELRPEDVTQINAQQNRLNILSIFFVVLSIAVVISLLIILYCYRRKKKKEMITA